MSCKSPSPCPHLTNMHKKAIVRRVKIWPQSLYDKFLLSLKSCGIAKHGKTNKVKLSFTMEIFDDIKLSTTKVSNFLSFNLKNMMPIS